MACEMAAFVLWILQQHLYTAERSHCPPRIKAPRPQGNFHADIFLIISHNAKAETKPYLSVIK